MSKRRSPMYCFAIFAILLVGNLRMPFCLSAEGQESDMSRESGTAGDAQPLLTEEVAKVLAERNWKDYTVYLIAQSHIDLAWNWRWQETVEKCKNTFSSALDLMDRYPEFTYTQSQPQAYSWMEERHPEIFREIKKRAEQGRWGVVGAMWVEADTNLPCGESLVRQIVHGKRYYMDRFRIDSEIGWLYDSFGLSWVLPQIYRKCGVKYLMTAKLTWNDTTRFPYPVFWWQARDGSRVLTYLPLHVRPDVIPAKVLSYLKEFEEYTGLKEMMLLYGWGDGGGGPREKDVKTIESLQKTDSFPRLLQTTPLGYLKKISSSTELPTWNDELYLEYHRGTYTTQAKTKKNNRKSEVLMMNAEKFASWANLYGVSYPQEELRQAWQKLLFNQFHDILPGTSIREVYEDSQKDFDGISSSGNKVLDNSLKTIASKINTQGKGRAVAIFNPLSWSRDGLVELTLESQTDSVIVEDTEGVRLPVQVAGFDGNSVKLILVARDVPPLGYRLYRLLSGDQEEKHKTALTVEKGHIENQFYRITIDPQSGCMTSIFDKVNKREVLDDSGRGNLLQAFVDKPKDWDAWNIDLSYQDKVWNLTDVSDIKIMENGPVRGIAQIKKKFQNSTFEQNVILYHDIPRIDCQMNADWHEKHILLKVAFPVRVPDGQATYEIPYGTIVRSAHPVTPAEKAKYEVPAQNWADLSNREYGVGLLNDCKYGYDIKDNVMRLTLLRSPVDPDPHADEGNHSFTYSLYPHPVSSDSICDVMRRGYELNYPLIPLLESSHPGELPPGYSFVSIQPGNIILTVVKKADDSEAIIMRFYDVLGKETTTRITLPRNPTKVYETDMLERNIDEIRIKDNTFEVPTGAYEIKTVKVVF